MSAEKEFCLWLLGVFDGLALTCNSIDLEAKTLHMVEKRLRAALAEPLPGPPAEGFAPRLYHRGAD